MKKVGFTPGGTGILLNWREVTDTEKTSAGIIVPQELREERAAKLNGLENGITSVAAIGPDVKQYKVGDWVLLKSAGRLINVEGEQYGLVAEHQIEGKYDKEPDTKRTDALSPKPGTMKTEKTEKKALDFKNKYNL